jgi:hypothetical protein
VLLAGALLAYWLGTRDNFQTWYLVNVRGPQLEKEFGFSAAFEEIADSTGSSKYFTLTSVDPMGVLGQAGIRSRDVPVGYEHGFQAGFLYDLLLASQGQNTKLWVVAKSDFLAGRSAWRRIEIPARVQP